MPTLEVLYNHTEKQTDYYTVFEELYDKHSPKAFGFIIHHADTKEQAEEYLEKVFLKVWENIKSFDDNADKKMQQIVLVICKPLYKRF